jgi:hypothetical protein
MSLGLGIFLSSLIFAPIALYALTRNSWNWRKIALLSFVGTLVVGVLVVGLFFVSRYFLSLPSKQTEYAGLRLGMPMDEVIYADGVPDWVYEPTTEGEWKGWDRIVETKDLEKGKRVQDYDRWSFTRVGSRIDVDFDKKTNELIAVECYSEDKQSRCPLIEGIKDGDSEQDLLSRFGKPSTSKLDGVSKTIDYLELGVRFILTKQQVYLLGIHNTKYRSGG